MSNEQECQEKTIEATVTSPTSVDEKIESLLRLTNPKSKPAHLMKQSVKRCIRV